MAERQIRGLKQRSSATRYTSEFRQIAARLHDWLDHVLVQQYYLGLKEEVKDDMSRGKRPETLHEMEVAAVDIDN